MGQVRRKGRPSFLRRGTPALLRLRLVAEPYAPVVPLGSAMSDVWTTFFRTSGNPGDVPPRGPSDDSAPRQSEGGPANRDDGGDDHDHRDVHGGAGGDDERVSEEPIDPWAQAAWSGGQSGDWWGHSGWAVNDRWSSYEEPRESWWEEYSWPRQDRRQSYGGTWGSTSAGSGSLQDSSAKEAEGYEGGNEAWRYRGGAALPGGWQPQKLAGDLLGAPRGGDLARGPSEKMVVPAFSGALENGSEDIGASARSYMRQVAAWRRMTRIDPSRQALTLYQHLTGKAWIDAERLDVDKLAGSDGMEYYLSWVTDRYLDVQVTQIGRSLGDFFRRLRRRQGQSVRDYMSDYDRALARLQECGCHLPDIAAAWVFVDRMALSEEQELNLLASVQNEYSLKRLQQAAIVQDRNLRKPWEPTSGGARPDRDRGGKWWGARRPQQANMANDALPEEDEQGDWLPGDDQSECVPEQVAEELYEAFMTHESAKQKYKEMSKLRGNDPEGMRQLAAERLQQAKNKSFCSGCRRRGHWHRDPECPLNQQRNGPASTRPSGPPAAPSAKDDNNPKTSYACHYVYVTWDLDQKLALPNLTAITDTACSRSVAGVPWIEKYMVEAKKIGFVPETVECKDAFKFGASRIFDSSYAVVISFGIGAHTVLLRVGVVNGDVPLLVSRPALAQLGMVMDLAENTASFRKLGVQDLTLLSTDTGHPALPVFPQTVSSAAIKSCDWRSRELLTVPKPQQYTAFMTIHSSVDPGDDGDSRVEAPPLLPGLSLASTETPEVAQDPKVFYPKKISIEAFNILTSDKLSPASFRAWWSQTPVTNDFWIEDELLLHRIHVTPRRTFFDPRGWNTTKFEQKSALLDALGSMRSSQGFACSTQRAFPEVHDQWKEPGSKSSFPLLWIGRTSFSRAARQCVRPAPLALHGLPCEPSDGSGGHQEEGTMGPPARRAFGGSEGPGTADSQQLDGARDSLDHSGGHEEEHTGIFESRELRRDLPLDQDDSAGAGGGVGGIWNGSAGQGQQGHAHETSQRPRWPWPSDCPDLRTLPRLHVPRDSDIVPSMGGKGGFRERRCPGGLEDVRDVGGEGSRGDRRLRDQLHSGALQGLRGERPGALQPGVFRRELVGSPDDRTPGSHEEQGKGKGEGPGDGKCGDGPTTSSATTPGPISGVFLGEPDGARSGPGGDGRDPTPPIETRCATGSPWSPSFGVPPVSNDYSGNSRDTTQIHYQPDECVSPDVFFDPGGADVYEAGRNRQHGASFVRLPDGDRSFSHFGQPLRGACNLNSLSAQATVSAQDRDLEDLPDQTTAGVCHRNPGDLPDQTTAGECPRNLGDLPDQTTAGECHRNLGDLPDQTTAGECPHNPGDLPDQTTAGVCQRNLGDLPDQTTAGECHRDPGDLPDQTTAGECPRNPGDLPDQTTAGECPRNLGDLPDQTTAGECHRNLHGLPDLDTGGPLVVLDTETVVSTPFDQVVDEVYLQDEVEEGHLPSDHHGKSLEEAAHGLLKAKRFSLEDLRDLLPLLPIKDCRRRRGVSGGPTSKVQSFLGGLWNHGGLHGISKDSCRYPKFVCYVNEVMKRQDSSKELGWSSFIITKNVATSIHRDAHNLAGSLIYSVSVGDFTGGHVWVERDNSDDPLHMPVVWRPDRNGDPVPGYTMSTQDAPHTLDPRRRHATEPWVGERWCISCYTGRAYPKTDARLRDGLRELRFPLRTLSYALDKDKDDYVRAPRPIKSTRRGLWRNAKRIIALTTWCSYAASTCLLPEFPLGRRTEGATLFEIGGTNKTFEAHDFGYLTAEPLGADVFMQESGLSMATAVLDS